jgi:tetratricopeptide (TPR) repeat protein
LAIDSNDVSGLIEKGIAIGGLGKFEEAITYFDRALAIDPTMLLHYSIKG